MGDLPECPECGSTYTYEDRGQYACPECGHEWPGDSSPDSAEAGIEFIDANGNKLVNGDSVVVIKDRKVKGTSFVIKVGTKIKNIRLNENDHHLDCKISGIGMIKLLPSVVKKT